MNRLPPEILLDIFLSASNSDPRSVLALSATCRATRSVYASHEAHFLPHLVSLLSWPQYHLPARFYAFLEPFFHNPSADLKELRATLAEARAELSTAHPDDYDFTLRILEIWNDLRTLAKHLDLANWEPSVPREATYTAWTPSPLAERMNVLALALIVPRTEMLPSEGRTAIHAAHTVVFRRQRWNVTGWQDYGELEERYVRMVRELWYARKGVIGRMFGRLWRRYEVKELREMWESGDLRDVVATIEMAKGEK